MLRQVRKDLGCRVEILGPVAAPLAKIRGRYRHRLLLKAVRRTDLHRLLSAFRGAVKLPSVVRLSIDIDPLDML
jgi:primosomal protein N' (replication factor Y)